MEEPEKPTKIKDQIRHDKEVAQRLQAQIQAKLEDEDKYVRQREEEANIVSWDNVQAMIDTDFQMAQQMQAEEQEKLSIEEKEDLETLYMLVKAKYGSTRPVEDLDLVLYGDLKTMFEPHVEDNVWKNQSDYRVLDWKLYDSCGVHSLRKQNVHIHMLVEKRCPLTAPTITNMLNRKLQADH
ncbi:hypothetical protein Tco_0626288 [Tanacetum coccineum]|uniref:Uncharacterized protein n=1 Tax=Tanacetum coccineum TaxID=301880 RepID=A0ABQ4WJ88_9ASTR